MEKPELSDKFLTKDEFFDACREALPELTREEFDRLWDEFQKGKAARAAKLETQ